MQEPEISLSVVTKLRIKRTRRKFLRGEIPRTDRGFSLIRALHGKGTLPCSWYLSILLFEKSYGHDSCQGGCFRRYS